MAAHVTMWVHNGNTRERRPVAIMTNTHTHTTCAAQLWKIAILGLFVTVYKQRFVPTPLKYNGKYIKSIF